MEYMPPINGNLSDPNRPYINANPQLGIEGSVPNALSFSAVMHEILNTIIGAGLTPDGDDLTQLRQAIVALAPVIPAGMKMWWPSLVIPTGYLTCNGAAISRTSYAALFAVIGTTYGAGDGSTTFNLPDDRGEFIRGLDLGRGVDPGRTLGSFQADELKAHTHTVPGWDDLGAFPGLGATSDSANNNVTSSSTGGAETRPRNKAYVPIIKF